MSGTNKAVMSSIILKGKGESALIKALENANEEAIKDEKKKEKKSK